MKKVLSLILAALMVFSILPAAFAADTTSAYKEALEALSAIGLLRGDENGNLMENALVERYQMAILAARFKTGRLDNAYWASIADSANFTDLAEFEGRSAESLGAIAYASEQKIVNGTDNGKFEPNAPVIYQDAVTMIVRALGYTDLAYPDGYLEKAAKLHLTDNVTGVENDEKVKREVIAELLYRAMYADVDGKIFVTRLASLDMNSEVSYKYIGSNPTVDACGKVETVSDPTEADNKVLALTKTQAGKENTDTGRTTSIDLYSGGNLMQEGDTLRVSMRMYVDGDGTANDITTALAFLQMRFVTDKGNLYMPTFALDKKDATGFCMQDQAHWSISAKALSKQVFKFNTWYTLTYDFTITDLDSDNKGFSVTVFVDDEQIAESTNFYIADSDKNDPANATLCFGTESLTMELQPQRNVTAKILFDDITVERVRVVE